MKQPHKKILHELEKRPLSSDELQEKTGYSYSGIRGRIAEMRKLGFDIELKEVTEKKYVLKQNSKKEKFLDFIEEINGYNRVVNLKQIEKETGLTEEDITNVISKMFLDPDYHIFQMSNTDIKITRLT